MVSAACTPSPASAAARPGTMSIGRDRVTRARPAAPPSARPSRPARASRPHQRSSRSPLRIATTSRQRAVVADVAGEHHVRHADRLGGRVQRPEHRDHAREQLAGHLGAADAQPAAGHVVRGDPALGDDPGGPGGQRLADDPGQGRGHRAGDRQAAGRVAARQPPRGWCTAARPTRAARAVDPPRRAGDATSPGRATSGGTSSSTRSMPPRPRSAASWRLVWPDVRPDHDQAVPARRAPSGRPDLRCRAAAPAGSMPASARTNDGPVRNRNDWPARSATSTPRRDRLQVGVLGGVDHDPRRRPAPRPAARATRAGPPSRMSARLMLRDLLRPDRAAALLRHEVPQVRRACSRTRRPARTRSRPTGTRRPPTRAQWISPAVSRPASRNAGTSSTPS